MSEPMSDEQMAAIRGRDKLPYAQYAADDRRALLGEVDRLRTTVQRARDLVDEWKRDAADFHSNGLTDAAVVTLIDSDSLRAALDGTQP
jgi:hypothetical protein